VLVELHIENLGVIERASLAFGPGMTALTGETGAGKTMLVEAIELLVGGRADATIVRHGADEARVDGRFLVARDDESVEIVLTRVVPADGRSRAYVNGRPATAATLADEARTLVDLHGQHAHQSLMTPAAQREGLDRFANVDLSPLRHARARVTELEAELATLGGDERVRAREIDLLRYQVGELDAADIVDPLEDDALATEEATLADAQGHRAAGDGAVDSLRGELGADESIAGALRLLDGRPPFAPLAERLTALSSELDEVVRELRDTSESIEEDPERLDAIRERRQLLVDLRRKYGESLDEVMSFHREAAERLRELLDYDRRAAELDAELVAARAVADDAARRVRSARTAAAPALAAQVESRLRELALPDAAVAIEVGTDDRGDRDDRDLAGEHVRFLFSANPGSPLLPLQRVASGGELARTMLALRLVLSSGPAGADVSTLVFDEVDAGIGGSAANAVGVALADLAHHHQVLVVTHLAQVGGRAQRQHVVSKEVRGGRTYASVSAVTGDDRVAEIARMLTGSVTDAALEHARELLDAPPPAPASDRATDARRR
jgi:DNA repair protein RecN (Recombination protein N)